MDAQLGSNEYGGLPEGERVRAFVRSRPTQWFADDLLKLSTNVVHLRRPRKPELQRFLKSQGEAWDIGCDGVLHNASQEDVYSQCAQLVVDKALEGFNGTVLCYGQTGAGKTYTMSGPPNSYDQRGIIPRAIAHVFHEVYEQAERAFSVHASYLEIYNDVIYDLLADLPTDSKQAPAEATPLSISDVSVDGQISVKGLTLQRVESAEETLNYFFEGEMTRAVAQHALNSRSSRSHTIFTIYIDSRSRLDSDPVFWRSKLHLIDLAGSERLSKTKPNGQTEQEAMYINKSLSFLEQVVVALSDRRREHIPYRQSKLTHFLQDSLGGNCYTHFITNIWPEAEHMEETLSTVRFTSRVTCVPCEPAKNQGVNFALLVEEQKAEIQHLRDELSMRDTLAGKTSVSYEPLSAIEIQSIREKVEIFLETKGQHGEIEVENLRQVQETFVQFRKLYRSLEARVEARLRAKLAGEGLDIVESSPVAQQEPAKPERKRHSKVAAVQMDDDGQVGEVDGQGFGIGTVSAEMKATTDSAVAAKRLKSRRGAKASSQGKSDQSPTASTATVTSPSRPLVASGSLGSTTAVSSTSVAGESQTSVIAAVGSEVQTNAETSAPAVRPCTPPPREDAFEEFKSQDGAAINKVLITNKDILRQKKTQARDTSLLLNSLKEKTEKLQTFLSEKKREWQAEEELAGQVSQMRIIDEDQYTAIAQLRELKAQYRAEMDELQALNSEVSHCQEKVEKSRYALLNAFDQWYTDSFLPSTATIQSSAVISQRMLANGRPAQESTQTLMAHDTKSSLMAHDTKSSLQQLMHDDPDAAAFHKARMRTTRRTYYKGDATFQPSKPGAIVRVPRSRTTTMLTLM